MKKMFFFFSIFYMLIPNLYAADHSYLQKKHRTIIENWTLYAKLNISETEVIGIAISFFSGKWLFISGNAVLVCYLELPSNNFQKNYKFMIPLVHRVKHNYSTLDENFSGNILRYVASERYYYIETTLSKFKSKIKFYPQKDIVPYGAKGKLDWDNRKINGYSIPCLKVEALIEGISDTTIYGEGHLEHFWGDKMEEDHDWVVVHTYSGYDFIAAYRHENENWRKKLTGSFINISYPNNTNTKVNEYDYEISNWWYSKKSGRKYPVELKIKLPKKNIKLSVIASAKNQEINIMGMNYWMGFCEVMAEIEGMKTIGWAFYMPMGYKEK